MTRAKYILFAVLTSTVVVVLCAAGLLALDIYYHHKLLTSAGLNVWGYRGPTVGRKQPGERRIVVLGESTTFGYGVHWQETIPAYLQDRLNAPGGPRVTVVNLGYNAEGAHSYWFTLQDYAYLDYDAVVFYSGYNDLAGDNPQVIRHTSAVFRLTGYFPILPLVLREKSMSIMYGGHLESAYRGTKTVFKPGLMERTTASAIGAVANISASLDAQLKNPEPPSVTDEARQEGAECGPQWAYYCGNMYKAVKLALDRHKRVTIVTQPYLSPRHVDQQQRLTAFLTHQFAGNPQLQFTNLGEALSLKDRAMCWDAMHLTPAGNRVIADRLVGPVSQMIQ